MGWHCHNPLGLPVNLWTTGTEVCVCCQTTLCSVCHYCHLGHCHLALQGEISLSSDEHASESEFTTSSVMSHSVSSCFVAILNALGNNKSHHTTKPSVCESESVTKHSLHYLAWHYFIAVMGNGQNCWVQDGCNVKLQYTNIHGNPYSRMKEICVWSHTAATNSINIVWGPSSPSVIWLSAVTTQIGHSSMKSNLLTEYCHMFMYPRCCSAVYLIYISICFKWIVPGTKTWSEN